MGTPRTQMDDVYAAPEFYWGREPNPVCRRVCDIVSAADARGGRAIDLGSGEGRDAIALARHGFSVVALDVSVPGLRKARRWAADEGVPLETVEASLLDPRPSGVWHLVYSSGTLHYLPPERRPDFFAGYKASTAPGGVHALNAFVEKPFLVRPPDYAPDEFFYRSGELLAHYWDWEVIAFHEEIFDCHSGGVPHRHAMNTLIARKVAPSDPRVG